MRAGDDVLRDELVALLRARNAHMDFDQAVAGFPMDAINRKLPHVPYTAWHLLEHIRIAQQDILEYIRDPAYVSPPWPVGYWPGEDKEADERQWQGTIAAFHVDRAALERLIVDTSVDLLAPIRHAPQHTIIRELLLVADHNAYHLGELGVVRELMQSWPRDHLG